MPSTICAGQTSSCSSFITCGATSRFSQRSIASRISVSIDPELDRGVALDLLDERDLPIEVLARVLEVVGAVIVGLVPDVVARGGGALDARLGRAVPRRIAALENADAEKKPGGFGRGEMREHAVLGGQDQGGHIADRGLRLLQPGAHAPPCAGNMAMVEAQA